MNNTLTRKKKAVASNTRFDVINRYNVSIASLKNQIKQATGIDELTVLAGKIIDLEQQILVEKTAGYKELEKEKSVVEDKIDRIKRELRRLEGDLQHIDNKIDLKVNVYRRVLLNKIDTLSEEYTGIADQIKTLDGL
jgi:predicted  nucleic acid-binding Zn-ribbon protein